MACVRVTGARSSLAVDGTGRHVAFASGEGIELWDLAWPHAPRAAWPQPPHGRPGRPLLEWCAHDESGSLLASTSAERVLVWDVGSARLGGCALRASLDRAAFCLPAADAPVPIVDLHWSGCAPATLALCAADGCVSVVCLADAERAALRARVETHRHVHALRWFERDHVADLLALAHGDAIALYDARSAGGGGGGGGGGRREGARAVLELRPSEGGREGAVALACAPGGLLASGGASGSACWWDVRAPARPLRTLRARPLLRGGAGVGGAEGGRPSIELQICERLASGAPPALGVLRCGAGGERVLELWAPEGAAGHASQWQQPQQQQRQQRQEQEEEGEDWAAGGAGALEQEGAQVLCQLGAPLETGPLTAGGGGAAQPQPQPHPHPQPQPISFVFCAAAPQPAGGGGGGGARVRVMAWFDDNSLRAFAEPLDLLAAARAGAKAQREDGADGADGAAPRAAVAAPAVAVASAPAPQGVAGGARAPPSLSATVRLEFEIQTFLSQTVRLEFEAASRFLAPALLPFVQLDACDARAGTCTLSARLGAAALASEAPPPQPSGAHASVGGGGGADCAEACLHIVVAFGQGYPHGARPSFSLKAEGAGGGETRVSPLRAWAEHVALPAMVAAAHAHAGGLCLGACAAALRAAVLALDLQRAALLDGAAAALALGGHEAGGGGHGQLGPAALLGARGGGGGPSVAAATLLVVGVDASAAALDAREAVGEGARYGGLASERLIEPSSEALSVPAPRTSGGAFCAGGYLVTFFSPSTSAGGGGGGGGGGGECGGERGAAASLAARRLAQPAAAAAGGGGSEGSARPAESVRTLADLQRLQIKMAMADAYARAYGGSGGGGARLGGGGALGAGAGGASERLLARRGVDLAPAAPWLPGSEPSDGGNGCWSEVGGGGGGGGGWSEVASLCADSSSSDDSEAEGADASARTECAARGGGGARAPCARVAVSYVGAALLGLERRLARHYVLPLRSAHRAPCVPSACRANAALAAARGRRDVESAWRLVGDLAESCALAAATEAAGGGGARALGGGGWAATACGGSLVRGLLGHFKRARELQTLAMLTACFRAFLAPRARDELCPLWPVRWYARLLEAWRLPRKRAELLKLTGCEAAHRAAGPLCFDLLALKPHAPPLGRKAEPAAGASRRAALICALCRTGVRGSSAFCVACGHGGHVACMRDWFGRGRADARHVGCPAACGCGCLPLNTAFAVECA